MFLKSREEEQEMRLRDPEGLSYLVRLRYNIEHDTLARASRKDLKRGSWIVAFDGVVHKNIKSEVEALGLAMRTAKIFPVVPLCIRV
jgi:hypothetical protein